jgi:hypothetical protein
MTGFCVSNVEPLASATTALIAFTSSDLVFYDYYHENNTSHEENVYSITFSPYQRANK